MTSFFEVCLMTTIPRSLFDRGLGEYHRKNWGRATKNFERAYQLDPTLYTEIGMALSDAIAHKSSDGLQVLYRLEDKIRQRGVGDPEAAYKIAQAYAVLRDKTSATRMFAYSIDNGFFSYRSFLIDPLLENIRHEPQFPQIMNVARRRYESFKRTFLSPVPHCRPCLSAVEI